MSTSTITYRGEITAPGVAWDCRDRSTCDEHYVVRVDGLWWRAFHNESDAAEFVADAWAERVARAAESLERAMSAAGVF